MILIGLLQKHFFENLRSEKFPSHVISVRKQDLLDIRYISLSYNVFGVNLTNKSTKSNYLSNLGRLGKIFNDYFKNNNALLIINCFL